MEMKKVEVIKSFEFLHSKISLRADGIVVFEIYDNKDLDLRDAIELNDKLGEFSEGKKVAVLVFFGEFTNYTKEAKAFAAGPEGTKYIKCEAIMVKNAAHQLIASMYITFNKPLVPSKIFTKVEEAVKWLNSK